MIQPVSKLSIWGSRDNIVHVWYIKILHWFRGFLAIFLYLVLFSLCSCLFWELRDSGVVKNFVPKASESCQNFNKSNVGYLHERRTRKETLVLHRSLARSFTARFARHHKPFNIFFNFWYAPVREKPSTPQGTEEFRVNKWIAYLENCLYLSLSTIN